MTVFTFFIFCEFVGKPWLIRPGSGKLYRHIGINVVRLLRSTAKSSNREVIILGNMSFISLRELRTSTSKINDMLTDDGKIVVTSNGKPKAVMIQVNENDFEETLAVLNQIKLAKAINNIRRTAQSSGASEMSLDEINAEIAQSRKERRERLEKTNA